MDVSGLDNSAMVAAHIRVVCPYHDPQPSEEDSSRLAILGISHLVFGFIDSSFCLSIAEYVQFIPFTFYFAGKFM